VKAFISSNLYKQSISKFKVLKFDHPVKVFLSFQEENFYCGPFYLQTGFPLKIEMIIAG